MGIIFHNEWRIHSIFVAIIVMLISLFLSRALLSVSMILFLAATTIHKDIRSQLISFVKSPLLLAMSFLFFIPFLSGLWSSNQENWITISITKFPFVLLPIGFAGQWQLSEKQWKAVAVCFLTVVFLGCCWSFAQYFQNPDVINKSYLKAKTIPTPLDDDHVRFSWIVATD